MPTSDLKEQWDAYCARCIASLTPILQNLGYTLDEHQKHIKGERYLMQAVTTQSGRKIILTGTRNQDGQKVVIKASDDKDGIAELTNARENRALLHKIDFAAHLFKTPEEYYFEKQNGFLITIHEYIQQECAFLDRPLEEQFRFAIASFKAQEGAHATTASHYRLIRRAFDIYFADNYIRTFETFRIIAQNEALNAASALLQDRKMRIQQYCRFLVHTDFVPHNIRIRDDEVYLLDHSSIRFGNKYEGWARFLNFMTLHNPQLEQLLTDYVHDNRTVEEHEALQAMRVFRLGELVAYYQKATPRSRGALKELNATRITFWSDVLKAVLEHTQVESSVVETYKKRRDELRSEDEKERQRDLH